MPYVVRARSLSGEDREWSFDEAVEAAKKGVELLHGGTRDFTIEAPDGRFYRHDEVGRMVVDAQLLDARQA